jgi:4-amino-4-deoxy-L-arabinose transferase-like glycosyltransferase
MNKNKLFLWVSAILVLIVYFANLGTNDIWNPNEGYYADAVREMFRRHNFFDFFFNNHHRFNKPPLTYWSQGICVLIFGMNEFAIRLPMILFAIGTVWLTYLIAKRIYGKEQAIWAALAISISPLFLSNTRYSTPEIPLAFFFTLTLYQFLRAYNNKKTISWLLFYIYWGLTVLTKGYPYYVVIGGIVVVYLFIIHDFKLKPLLKETINCKIFWGVPLALALGLSWVAYSYLKFGEDFLYILNQETYERAFTYEAGGFFEELFFFPSVILWGFLPFSFIFYWSFVKYVKSRESIKKHAFALSWFVVILVIFSVAKFKLPTYFIQAHTAMALLTGYFLVEWNPGQKWQRILSAISFVVPGVVAMALLYYMIVLFKFHPVFYILALIPVLAYIPSKYNFYWMGKTDSMSAIWQYTRIFPFVALLFVLLLFSVVVLAKVETNRHYDKVGLLVNEYVPDTSIPLIVEDHFLYDIQYYAQRGTYGNANLVDVINYYNTYDKMVALIKEEDIKYFPEAQVLWKGLIYKRNSEAVFATFIQYHARLMQGDDAGFKKMALIKVDRTVKVTNTKILENNDLRK